MDLGLYMHIPFCRRKCDYCGFYSISLPGYVSSDINYRNEQIDAYIKILMLELRERSRELENHIVDTIYFGGGTPSLLSPAQLDILINEIDKTYKLANNNMEFTVECNPDDFSVDKINEYKRVGVNRIVLGVQTTNAGLHSIMGRSACLCSANMLSDFAGIQDIIHCADIILGMPGQTVNDLMRELNHITSYRFEHISAYTLSIEAGTPLAERTQRQTIDDMQRTLLEKAIDFFSSAGYEHYEVSNYALSSYQSKHNMKYWKFMPYAGFGPGAHSFFNGERYYNTKSLEQYIKSNGNIRQKDSRTSNSKIIEYILSGMRLSSGISFKDFESKLGIKVPDELSKIFKEMEKNYLLEIKEREDDSEINFTRKGFFLMDSLIYKMTEMFL